MKSVVVVGAGVVGLSCAVRLLEAGHRVAVFARDLPQETTSSVAAALWFPYLAYPEERVKVWASDSLRVLTKLAHDEPAHLTGVRLMPGTELLRRHTVSPWWAEVVDGLADEPRVPAGYRAGRSFVAPVVEMRLYLAYLTSRITDLGGTITRMALPGLPEHAEVVINASGLGARLLGSDLSVTPVRGQVVRVAQVGLERWTLDGEGHTYVIPRSSDIVVGGTEEPGEWERRPDPDKARAMLARATQLVPQLRGAAVLEHRVGLRPARPTVRLEASHASSGGQIVHCYGHGGAGVTLSWGCASEVTSLIR